MRFKIIPRLNFDFSFIDLILSFRGLCRDYNRKAISLITSHFPKSKGVLLLNHARTGIYLVLKSLSLPEGAKVGVLVYNCHTVFKAIDFAGFHPVFIDVDDDYRMCTTSLKHHANSLDGLIVTHLFGISAPMKEILEIMSGKPIIEDLAHSFLIEKNGAKLGSFGIASVGSFGQSKFPSAGQGGFVIFNDFDTYKKAKINISNIPHVSKLSSIMAAFKAYFMSVLMNKYIYGLITYKLKKSYGNHLDINEKFDFPIYQSNPLFSSVLHHRLAKVEMDLSKQKSNIRFLYDKALLNSYTCFKEAFFKIPIQISSTDSFLEKAINSGLEFGMHFSKSIDWAKEYGYKKGFCSNAELLIKKTITIPCHYNLNKDTLNKYVAFLNKNLIHEG